MPGVKYLYFLLLGIVLFYLVKTKKVAPFYLSALSLAILFPLGVQLFNWRIASVLCLLVYSLSFLGFWNWQKNRRRKADQEEIVPACNEILELELTKQAETGKIIEETPFLKVTGEKLHVISPQEKGDDLTEEEQRDGRKDIAEVNLPQDTTQIAPTTGAYSRDELEQAEVWDKSISDLLRTDEEKAVNMLLELAGKKHEEMSVRALAVLYSVLKQRGKGEKAELFLQVALGQYPADKQEAILRRIVEKQ